MVLRSSKINVGTETAAIVPYQPLLIWTPWVFYDDDVIKVKVALTVGINRTVFVRIPT
jgi:hypothetical protein